MNTQKEIVTGEGNAPRVTAEADCPACEANTIEWFRNELKRVEAQRDELLAALKQTLDALFNETYCRRQGDTQWIIGVKAAAKAAIAKAEGSKQ